MSAPSTSFNPINHPIHFPLRRHMHEIPLAAFDRIASLLSRSSLFTLVQDQLANPFVVQSPMPSHVHAALANIVQGVRLYNDALHMDPSLLVTSSFHRETRDLRIEQGFTLFAANTLLCRVILNKKRDLYIDPSTNRTLTYSSDALPYSIDNKHFHMGWGDLNAWGQPVDESDITPGWGNIPWSSGSSSRASSPVAPEEDGADEDASTKGIKSPKEEGRENSLPELENLSISSFPSLEETSPIPPTSTSPDCDLLSSDPSPITLADKVRLAVKKLILLATAESSEEEEGWQVARKSKPFLPRRCSRFLTRPPSPGPSQLPQRIQYSNSTPIQRSHFAS